MQADRSRSKPLRIEAAVCSQDTGPGGLGVVVRDAGPTVAGRLYEQAYGTREELLYRAVFRALELGKRLGADHVRVLCPDEEITRQINRETPVPQIGRLPILYIKVKTLMYTFGSAEVAAAPDGRVRSAHKLAVAASKIPQSAKPEPRTLFSAEHAAA